MTGPDPAQARIDDIAAERIEQAAADAARCGGRYGTRSTTPGTVISTDGVESGQILICELGLEPHEMHRVGDWQWQRGEWAATPVPGSAAALRADIADLLSGIEMHFIGCGTAIEGDGTCTCLIGRLEWAINAEQVSEPCERGGAA